MSMEDEHGVGGKRYPSKAKPKAKPKAKKDKKWIQGMDLKKGALRSELGVKKGKKIPAKKLAKAAKSSNPLLKKRAVLAENFRKMKK